MFDIRNVLTKLLIPCILITFSINAFSQEATTTSATSDENKIYLSIDDAIQYARENDTSYIESKYDYEIARAVKWQTTSDLWIPNVSLSGSLYFVDADTVTYNNVVGSQDRWSAGLDVSKVVFSGLALWYSDKISEVGVRSAEAALIDSEKNVVLNTKLDFYNLFILQENYKVFETSDRMLATSLSQTRVKYNNGMVSRYEYLSAQVQYENNRPTLLALSNSYYTAKLMFMKNIGLENENIEEVELVGTIEDALGLELPELNEEELIRTILNNNYDIKSMEYTLEKLEYARKASNSYWFPTIAVSGGVSLDSSDSWSTDSLGVSTFEREGKWSWKVGISLSYRLDSLIPISSSAQKAKEAQLNRDKVQNTYKNLKNSVEVQCRSLINTIRSQEASFESQKKNAETALYAYQMAASQYRGGTLSSIQLNDAQLAYQQAQVNYLQAVYDYYSSALQLLKLLDM